MNPEAISTVWLADDDDDDCMVFGDVLAECKPESKLTCVSNGQLVLDLLRSRPLVPDVLFLDLNMPIMNGLEALEHVKRDAKFRELPVVILSTSAQASAVEKSMALGARFFVRKPDSFDVFKQILQRIFAADLGASAAGSEFLILK